MVNVNAKTEVDTNRFISALDVALSIEVEFFYPRYMQRNFTGSTVSSVYPVCHYERVKKKVKSAC